MSTLQELPTLTAETPAILTTSSSMSSISTTSDDDPQLSFEYIAQDNTQPDALEATLPTNDTLLNDVLGNKPTAEHAQSITSVLSLSHHVICPGEYLQPSPCIQTVPMYLFGTHGQLGQSTCWPRCEASCAREMHQLRKSAKRTLRWLERTGKKRNASVKLRLRDKEKENWVGGIDAHVKDSSPSLLVAPEQPEHKPSYSQSSGYAHTAHVDLPLRNTMCFPMYRTLLGRSFLHRDVYKWILLINYGKTLIETEGTNGQKTGAVMRERGLEEQGLGGPRMDPWTGPRTCLWTFFLWPGCSHETRTQINITSHISFYMLINTLHDAIGCSGVKLKPKLKYKLTCVTKATLMWLQSVEDWEGLKEEIEYASKEEQNQSSVAVDIIVPDDYMESLCHTLGKGKNTDKKGTSKGHGGRTCKEIKITNLNTSDGEGVLRAWAEALATGRYGVTYKVPPNSKHFEEFHSNTANAVANAGQVMLCCKGFRGSSTKGCDRRGFEVPDAAVSTNGLIRGSLGIRDGSAARYINYMSLWASHRHHPAFYHPYAPQYSYHYPMQMMELAMTFLKKSQGRTRSPSPATSPSSDGPEITAAHTFLTISDFIDMLANAIQPGVQDCDLELLKTQFQSKQVHYIDELQGLTVEELKEKFSFLWGDVWFINKAVEKAIHKIDKNLEESDDYGITS
ncbi:hypothetical protein JB92DRAFT_3095443 [Gautieria morchelliformis]|nr:hypothetical protein JB92DRAFT_3095443 [Gautieria morchelliformis]